MDDPRDAEGAPQGPAMSTTTVNVSGGAPVVIHVSSNVVVGRESSAYSPSASANPAVNPAHVAARPGVADLVQRDATDRALSAVARRGPARLMAFGVGALASFAATACLLGWLFGGLGMVAMIGMVPSGLLAALAFAIGARTDRGVTTHHLEQDILRLAGRQAGLLRVAQLAQVTGRSLRECQEGIDTLVRSGYATVDADDQGSLVYRIPDLHQEHPRALPRGRE